MSPSPSTLSWERPSPQAPRAWKFPAFTRTRLDNGLTVVACDLPGHTLIAGRLLLEAGALTEPAGKEGIGSLAAGALMEGTLDKDDAALADAIESIGATVNAGVGWDVFTLMVDAPRSRFEAALELAAEVIRRPAFPEDGVRRLINRRLSGLRQEEADPSSRADREWRAALFGGASVYGRRIAGDASVGALTRDEIAEHLATFATPVGATLVVAGDLSGLGVEKLADRLFGDWSAPEPIRPAVKVPSAAGKHLTLINRPGSVQSAVVVGQAGPARKVENEAALTLGSTWLAGTFNGRVNWRLREELGYTYGARGDFVRERDGGVYQIDFTCQSPSTVDAVSECLAQVKLVLNEGLRDDEIEAARDYRMGSLPVGLQTPAAVAAHIDQIVTYDLADDHWDTFRAGLAKATPDEANAALRKHLDIEKFVVAVVGDGDADGIREGLTTLDAGQVVEKSMG